MKAETLCAPKQFPKQSVVNGNADKQQTSTDCANDVSKVVDWEKGPKLNEEHQPVGEGDHWEKSFPVADTRNLQEFRHLRKCPSHKCNAMM